MPEAFLSALYHELMAPPDSWNRELIPLPVPIFPQVPMCMGKAGSFQTSHGTSVIFPYSTVSICLTGMPELVPLERSAGVTSGISCHRPCNAVLSPHCSVQPGSGMACLIRLMAKEPTGIAGGSSYAPVRLCCQRALTGT